jgi:hypothetical protein
MTQYNQSPEFDVRDNLTRELLARRFEIVSSLTDVSAEVINSQMYPINEVVAESRMPQPESSSTQPPDQIKDNIVPLRSATRQTIERSQYPSYLTTSAPQIDVTTEELSVEKERQNVANIYEEEQRRVA